MILNGYEEYASRDKGCCHYGYNEHMIIIGIGIDTASEIMSSKSVIHVIPQSCLSGSCNDRRSHFRSERRCDRPRPLFMAWGRRLKVDLKAGERLRADMLAPAAEATLWSLRRRQDAHFPINRCPG